MHYRHRINGRTPHTNAVKHHQTIRMHLSTYTAGHAGCRQTNKSRYEVIPTAPTANERKNPLKLLNRKLQIQFHDQIDQRANKPSPLHKYLYTYSVRSPVPEGAMGKTSTRQQKKKCLSIPRYLKIHFWSTSYVLNIRLKIKSKLTKLCDVGKEGLRAQRFTVKARLSERAS